MDVASFMLATNGTDEPVVFRSISVRVTAACESQSTRATSIACVDTSMPAPGLTPTNGRVGAGEQTTSFWLNANWTPSTDGVRDGAANVTKADASSPGLRVETESDESVKS